MKSYEALQKAINGKTVDFAKRLGLATVTVNKWQEPASDYTDSGSYNPLDRIETIVETAVRKKHDDSLAPIYYLTEKFNLLAIPMPEIVNHVTEELTKELLATVREFSNLAQAASEAMTDGKISKAEASRVDAMTWQLVRQAMIYNFKVQEAVKK